MCLNTYLLLRHLSHKYTHDDDDDVYCYCYYYYTHLMASSRTTWVG